MTREQAKQNLIGFGIAEPTDEQITNYLNQIGAETKHYKDKLASVGGKDDRIAELEKELEKLNKQNMSDLELANAERDFDSLPLFPVTKFVMDLRMTTLTQ